MRNNKKNIPVIIAITGGIGSGKSTALKIIKEAGEQTFSCDEITNDLYKTHAFKATIKKLFPSAVSGEKRLTVNKKRIAELCFNDDDNYKKLSDAVTAPVFNETMKRAKKSSAPRVFIEVPLLFEYGLQNYFDKTIIVMRDKKTRIESVKRRSNLDENEIINRINRQFDYDNVNLGDYIIINNDGDESALKKAVLDTINDI